MPKLLKLAEAFVKECGYGWNFYPEASEKRIREFMEADSAEVLVSNEVDGVVLVQWDRDFIEEAVGYVVKFYVGQEGRGKGTAKELVRASDSWFKEKGCRHVFGTVTGNISPELDAAYRALFEKNGYKVQGACLVKGLYE